MKIRNDLVVLSIVSTLVLLSGCAAKNVYKPQSVTQELPYQETENIHIRNIVREGATLSNRKVLSKQNSLSSITIPEGFSFANDNASELIIVSKDGGLKILSYKDGHTTFSKKFDVPVVSVTSDKDTLALVLANNTIMLYDMKVNQVLYEESLEKVMTIDARAANPVFLNDLVIFPTLDGRLLIMDKNKKVILRDVAISDKDLFNNVIYLKVANNKLITATASKVMVITPTNIYTHKENIKDILYVDHNVYLFTKNGMVIRMDEKLQTITEKKFKFANFLSVAAFNGKLYAVEKEGYLLEMDKNLENVKVEKLFDEIEKPVMIVKDVFYIDDKTIKLK